MVLVGLSILGGSLLLGRQRWAGRPRRVLGGIAVGIVFATLGAIGLVEIQVEPTTAPQFSRQWYQPLAYLTGTGILLASVILGRLRWWNRPSYMVLGSLLGFWVAYPVLVPGLHGYNPLGYLLVMSVPIVVGYILWRDVQPALVQSLRTRQPRIVAGGVSLLFVGFFLVSAGLLTFNPDTGVNGPWEPFVVTAQFRGPLVIWPAIEAFFPSIPVFVAMSVGMAIALTLLTTLVGVNAALTTLLWQQNVTTDSYRGTAGAIMTTGATSCCCCAPAAYGLLSAALGATASPVYWAFTDPSSPLGIMFFVAAIGLLTASVVRTANELDNAEVCRIQG